MSTAVKFDRAALRRYRADPVLFIEQILIDPESGCPFVLLPAERSFLAHAFKTGPDGRLLYPELLFAAPKKSGKTTLSAIVTLTMVILYGGRFAEAICCANDYEQAASRVFQQIRRIVECSPLLRAEAKITADRIVVAGATIIAIPANYASAAGANPVISVFDELWGFVSESARRLFDELVPPPTRKVACRLVMTYAGFSSESVLLEELHKRGTSQPLVGPSLHAGDGILCAWHHEPIAPWQTVEWVEQMRRSLRPNQFLRMIENRFVTSESSFIDLASWDSCVDHARSRAVSDRSLPVWVGVDASVKHDSTAIVAVTWDAMTQRVVLVWHRVFQPSPTDPLDFESSIEQSLYELSRNFRVVEVRFDPYQMAASSQRLTRAGVPMVEYPQTQASLTAASQNLFELVTGRNFVAYADAPMRLAVSRAVALETARGWRIAKEKQSHKIDVVVALAMACHACVQGQAVAPVIITNELLGRIMQMPKRREFGSMRSSNLMLSPMTFRPSPEQQVPAAAMGSNAQQGKV
jgi:phage terminase large subunit-like protein